jgi:hypothetical protein
MKIADTVSSEGNHVDSCNEAGRNGDFAIGRKRRTSMALTPSCSPVSPRPRRPRMPAQTHKPRSPWLLPPRSLRPRSSIWGLAAGLASRAPPRPGALLQDRRAPLTPRGDELLRSARVRSRAWAPGASPPGCRASLRRGPRHRPGEPSSATSLALGTGKSPGLGTRPIEEEEKKIRSGEMTMTSGTQF